MACRSNQRKIANQKLQNNNNKIIDVSGTSTGLPFLNNIKTEHQTEVFYPPDFFLPLCSVFFIAQFMCSVFL
jgi:hypothetical protein